MLRQRVVVFRKYDRVKMVRFQLSCHAQRVGARNTGCINQTFPGSQIFCSTFQPSPTLSFCIDHTIPEWRLQTVHASD